ncbi:hypothetical protein D3C86_1715510 [compost metagenome]
MLLSLISLFSIKVHFRFLAKSSYPSANSASVNFSLVAFNHLRKNSSGNSIFTLSISLVYMSFCNLRSASCLNMLSTSSVILAVKPASSVTTPSPNNLSKNSWFKSDSSKRFTFLTVTWNLDCNSLASSSAMFNNLAIITSFLSKAF